MNGGHEKDASPFAVDAATDFEPRALNENGEGFNDEDASDDDEEHFLFGADRDHAEHSADGKGAGIAHEDFCGVAVEPEEAEGGPDHGHADHREFASEWIKRNV